MKHHQPVTLVGESTQQKREEILAYFLESYSLFEKLFSVGLLGGDCLDSSWGFGVGLWVKIFLSSQIIYSTTLQKHQF